MKRMKNMCIYRETSSAASVSYAYTLHTQNIFYYYILFYWILCCQKTKKKKNEKKLFIQQKSVYGYFWCFLYFTRFCSFSSVKISAAILHKRTKLCFTFSSFAYDSDYWVHELHKRRILLLISMQLMPFTAHQMIFYFNFYLSLLIFSWFSLFSCEFVFFCWRRRCECNFFLVFMYTKNPFTLQLSNILSDKNIWTFVLSVSSRAQNFTPLYKYAV